MEAMRGNSARTGNGARSGRAEFFELLLPVSSTIVGVLLSVLGNWLLSPELGMTSGVVLVTLGFVLVPAIFGYAVSRWKKGSPRVAHLKDRLESAFSDALDQSPVNPRRASADHRA